MDWVEQAYILPAERSGIRGDEGLGVATREGGGCGHAWAFLLHAVTAVWASVAGGWVSLVPLLTVGVVCHLYPVLLQIHVLTRLRER